MKIGLFFGSFNPVHTGHLVIASYMSEFTALEQVWMVVSPHNPLKPAGELLQDYHRFKLVQLGIGRNRKIKASDVEFKLPKPSYTINTLRHLKEKFPEHTFTLILGSDNLETFKQWKHWEVILELCELYVYPRPLHDGGELKNHKQVKWIDAPLMQLSSTFIRKSIKQKSDVHYMMPEAVWNHIEEMQFYEK